VAKYFCPFDLESVGCLSPVASRQSGSVVRRYLALNLMKTAIGCPSWAYERRRLARPFTGSQPHRPQVGGEARGQPHSLPRFFIVRQRRVILRKSWNDREARGRGDPLHGPEGPCSLRFFQDSRRARALPGEVLAFPGLKIQTFGTQGRAGREIGRGAHEQTLRSGAHRSLSRADIWCSS